MLHTLLPHMQDFCLAELVRHDYQHSVPIQQWSTEQQFIYSPKCSDNGIYGLVHHPDDGQSQ
jgi:hypothetical protein